MPGFAGEVLASVSGAAYLEGSAGDLVWVCPPDAPAHPRGIHAPVELRRLGAGTRFAACGGVLQFESGVAIGVRDAPVWTPPP